MPSLRKQDAQRAVNIFRHIEHKYKDDRLCNYQKELLKLLDSEVHVS